MATPEIYTLSLHDALPICHRADVAERSLSYAGLCMARCGTPHVDRQAHHSCRFSRQSFRTGRSEEHTSELQSPDHLVCRLLLEKKKQTTNQHNNIYNYKHK